MTLGYILTVGFLLMCCFFAGIFAQREILSSTTRRAALEMREIFSSIKALIKKRSFSPFWRPVILFFGGTVSMVFLMPAVWAFVLGMGSTTLGVVAVNFFQRRRVE